jgi:hypothetical protein
LALSANERQLRARIGAYAQHASNDVRETTAAARDGFLRRFEDEVDPERKLPESERRRRAEAARRAHMSKLALASARARRKRKAS